MVGTYRVCAHDVSLFGPAAGDALTCEHMAPLFLLLLLLLLLAQYNYATRGEKAAPLNLKGHRFLLSA